MGGGIASFVIRDLIDRSRKSEISQRGMRAQKTNGRRQKTDFFNHSNIPLLCPKISPNSKMAGTECNQDLQIININYLIFGSNQMKRKPNRLYSTFPFSTRRILMDECLQG